MRTRVIGVIVTAVLIATILAAMSYVWTGDLSRRTADLEVVCKAAVQKGSLHLLDVIQDGRSIEDAWRTSSEHLKSLSEMSQFRDCPCWRSRWVLNPAAPEWTAADIDRDPTLAVAAFALGSPANIRVILISAQGSMRAMTGDALPPWALHVPIEFVE